MAGLFGIDSVVGKFGDDTLVGRTPPDLDDLRLGTSDRILGLLGNDTIYGNLRQDTLAGCSGDNVIDSLATGPVLLAAWGIAVAVQAALLVSLVRDPSPASFTRAVSLALALTALVAALWTLMPVAVTSACL